jgi:hypothetical protein
MYTFISLSNKQIPEFWNTAVKTFMNISNTILCTFSIFISIDGWVSIRKFENIGLMFGSENHLSRG